MEQNNILKTFDILIVGAGHAGLEAAAAASQFENLTVGLLTKTDVGIGTTPCNPAIGGVGKGQLVREISAMGGVMGHLADGAAIQCRYLNESKGDAVRSTRMQVDKEEYSRLASEYVSGNKNIDLIVGELVDLQCLNTAEFEVRLTDSSLLIAKKVILTVGTFFNGVLHKGAEIKKGGRVDCPASVPMSDLGLKIELVSKKFKTGTPPRICRSSINYELMEKQESDPTVMNFDFIKSPFGRKMSQMACYKTHTNPNTIKLVLDNKENSPMFNGQIKGTGPRYCPSIEDKAYRYPEKNNHHIFVEPEGRNLETIYPNGISTSLPESVQLELVQTIKGMENSKILIPGYAVEYDVVDTSFLDHSLEYVNYPGLYFAGQVNGTSGYEEAAAQGLVAGLNAAMACQGRKPVVFPRGTSYVGVLIDDLVSNKRDEPYRLFTARAENRLYIREDNAINRLAEYRLGLSLNGEIDSYIKNYLRQWDLLAGVLTKLTKSESDNGKLSDRYKTSSDLNNYLSSHAGVIFDPRVTHAFFVTEKYDGYIKRQSLISGKSKKLDSKRIDYNKILASLPLSNECRELIKENAPKSFFHLRNIRGIRPATLSLVASTL